jgi:hypothetical protein
MILVFKYLIVYVNKDRKIRQKKFKKKSDRKENGSNDRLLLKQKRIKLIKKMITMKVKEIKKVAKKDLFCSYDMIW